MPPVPSRGDLPYITSMTRTLIRFSGPDTRSFLDGLITNTLPDADDPLRYAALLTPQGKFIADFLVLADGDDLILDVAASHAPTLAQRLTMYRLRAKVDIAEDPRAVSTGTGEAPLGAMPDPRHDALGWRLYGSDAPDRTDRDAIRVAHCIPETGIELTPDTYILEAGFERLNGVDFRKGCFVGQEIVARMKHKTELRKGLATVSISGSAPVGTEITTGDGRPAGTLFTQSGDRAIAHLRFDRADGPLSADAAHLQRL